MPPIATPKIAPAALKVVFVDIIDDRKFGTCSRTKLEEEAIVNAANVAESDQKNTDIHIIGTNEKTIAKTPDINAPTIVSSFLP